jgi:hypothetical protein
MSGEQCNDHYENTSGYDFRQLIHGRIKKTSVITTQRLYPKDYLTSNS